MNAPATFPQTAARYALNLEQALAVATAANKLHLAYARSKGRQSTAVIEAEIAFTLAVQTLLCDDNLAEARENLRFELGQDKFGEDMETSPVPFAKLTGIAL